MRYHFETRFLFQFYKFRAGIRGSGNEKVLDSVKTRFKVYKKRPLSLVLFLAVILSAVVTFSVLIYLIGYILVMGIPNISWDLFAWEYNSENNSLMPAL